MEFYSPLYGLNILQTGISQQWCQLFPLLPRISRTIIKNLDTISQRIGANPHPNSREIAEQLKYLLLAKFFTIMVGTWFEYEIFTRPNLHMQSTTELAQKQEIIKTNCY